MHPWNPNDSSGQRTISSANTWSGGRREQYHYANRPNDTSRLAFYDHNSTSSPLPTDSFRTRADEQLFGMLGGQFEQQSPPYPLPCPPSYKSADSTTYRIETSTTSRPGELDTAIDNRLEARPMPAAMTSSGLHHCSYNATSRDVSTTNNINPYSPDWWTHTPLQPPPQNLSAPFIYTPSLDPALPGISLHPAAALDGHPSRHEPPLLSRQRLPTATGWHSPVTLSDISPQPSATLSPTSQSALSLPPSTRCTAISIRSDPSPISPTPAALLVTNVLRTEARRAVQPGYACEIPRCLEVCKRRPDLDRHRLVVHAQSTVHYHCGIPGCTYYYPRIDKVNAHCRDERYHNLPAGQEVTLMVTDAQLRAARGCPHNAGCGWYQKRAAYL